MDSPLLGYEVVREGPDRPVSVRCRKCGETVVEEKDAAIVRHVGNSLTALPFLCMAHRCEKSVFVII